MTGSSTGSAPAAARQPLSWSAWWSARVTSTRHPTSGPRPLMPFTAASSPLCSHPSLLAQAVAALPTVAGWLTRHCRAGAVADSLGGPSAGQPRYQQAKLVQHQKRPGHEQLRKYIRRRQDRRDDENGEHRVFAVAGHGNGIDNPEAG